MKLPSFDGTDNVLGFFTMFERLCAKADCDEEHMASLLISNLKGTA